MGYHIEEYRDSTIHGEIVGYTLVAGQTPRKTFIHRDLLARCVKTSGRPILSAKLCRTGDSRLAELQWFELTGEHVVL